MHHVVKFMGTHNLDFYPCAVVPLLRSRLFRRAVYAFTLVSCSRCDPQSQTPYVHSMETSLGSTTVNVLNPTRVWTDGRYGSHRRTRGDRNGQLKLYPESTSW